jgi:hypothetical protein
MLSQFFILALITSLKIVFVWAAMQEGMILFFLKRLIDWIIVWLPAKVYLWIRKPLYNCLFCMASFWGYIFSFEVASFSWYYLEFLMTVAGINYLIQWFITATEDIVEKEPDWERGNQVFSNIIHRFDKQ